jgi:hypothetical protein
MLGVAAACGVAVVVRPRLLVYLLPLLGVLLVLRFFGWLLQPLPMKTKPSRAAAASRSEPTNAKRDS